MDISVSGYFSVHRLMACMIIRQAWLFVMVLSFPLVAWQGCVLIGWFCLSLRPKIVSEIPIIIRQFRSVLGNTSLTFGTL